MSRKGCDYLRKMLDTQAGTLITHAIKRCVELAKNEEVNIHTSFCCHNRLIPNEWRFFLFSFS
jgi:hypothetical protein